MQEIAVWFKTINWHCSSEEYQKALAFFTEKRNCVRDHFDKLSWYADQDEQQSAITYLSQNLQPWEYIYLVFADKYSSDVSGKERRYYRHRTGKDRWENAAKTVVQIGWPKIENILLPLFMWLLDPNWPGSELIYSFILTLPQEVITDKMNAILNNPQGYTAFDYTELVALIEQIKAEKSAEDG